MRLLSLLQLATIVAASTVAAAEPPKLVVAIVVDQLRADYLERFRPQLADGGFKRLMDGGAHLTFAHYDYFPTITAPGHASIFSGSTPMMHGIIGNDWFDKATRKLAYCVSDPTVAGVGTVAKAGQMSPRNLVGTTVADQMRLHFRSKVIGISMKDRGAILPAGKKPAGAYWFEPASGNFITSSYYAAELPAWVSAFNARRRPAEFVGKTWERLLEPEAYFWEDAARGELPLPGEKTVTFPHAIARSEKGVFDVILPTPWSNELLLEFALAALDGERLGEGSGPDLFTISFSGLDAIGHRFGPYSHEVQDAFLRLDRQLAKLLDALDRKLGLANVAVLLTSDHGVAPTPEFAADQGLDGFRVDRIERMGSLLAMLGERFTGTNVLLARNIFDGQLYFDHAALSAAEIEPYVVFSAIREWALASGKYHACYSREQLLEGRAPGPFGERVIRGYNAERGGDAVLVMKPFVIDYDSYPGGTNHGSLWSHDTHVPVVFYGSHFTPGRYAVPFAITDIAPTLCTALGITEPAGSMGKPCIQILAGQR